MFGNFTKQGFSEFNRTRLARGTKPMLARQLLSLERRLLFRELNAEITPNDSGSNDEEFWDQISVLLENYRRIEWLNRGMSLNLTSPRTLGEKIEWLKFNYHAPLLVQLVDKLKVREFVVSRTGDPELLNDLYGVYECVNDIPLDDLPEAFVARTNHRSGDTIVCRQTLQPRELRARFDLLEMRLKRDYSTYHHAEWPYSHIQSRVVLVEKYLEDQFGQLIDYKVFSFNGVPKFIMVCKGRYANLEKSFFDLEWKQIPVRDPRYPRILNSESCDVSFPRPESLDNMLTHSSALSKGLPFLRCDFYDVFGKCLFGELTIYPERGINCIFDPVEWNSIFGEWLTLHKPIRKPKYAFANLLRQYVESSLQ